MMSRSKLTRQSNSLTLLRGTGADAVLQLLSGDPSKPIATLNHSVDMKSIAYMVAGGAGLIIFSKIISPNKK